MKITVEVSYALPGMQQLRRVVLEPPATIGGAIAASGMLLEYPQIDLKKNKVGIFGRRSSLDDVLCDGDRVEIYRPLTVDPKEARRMRAGHAKRIKR